MESGGLGHTSPSCLLSSVLCAVCWEELGQALELCCGGEELSWGGFPLQIEGPSCVTLGILLVAVCRSRRE